MSADLYWRPVNPEPSGRSVSGGLHFLLGPRLWGHDGTLTSESWEVDESLIPFLEGIEAAGSPENAAGARELIDAIENHGTIEILIAR